MLYELSELFLKIDYTKSIKYLEKILKWYIQSGDIHNIIKTLKSIGDIYFNNNCLEDAFTTYTEVLEIINSNDKCIDVKKNIIEKMSELYYMKESIINLSKLSNLYFSIGDDYLKKNFGYVIARNYILNGLLMNLAMEDIVQTKLNFEKYCDQDSTFQNSREGVFVLKIMDAIEKYNYEEISFLCAEYDKIKQLDRIQVKLLTKIKENIGCIDYSNDEDNNEMDDVDLC